MWRLYVESRLEIAYQQSAFFSDTVATHQTRAREFGVWDFEIPKCASLVCEKHLFQTPNFTVKIDQNLPKTLSKHQNFPPAAGNARLCRVREFGVWKVLFKNTPLRDFGVCASLVCGDCIITSHCYTDCISWIAQAALIPVMCAKIFTEPCKSSSIIFKPPACEFRYELGRQKITNLSADSTFLNLL